MNVQTILREIEESLEPLREAKRKAEEQFAKAQTLKDQSAANVVHGETDLRAALQNLENYESKVRADKEARARERAERIAGGLKPEASARKDELVSRVKRFNEETRLKDELEEAEGFLSALRDIDAERALELANARATVRVATDAIYLAHTEAIAVRMLEHEALIRQLHEALTALVPTEINRPRNMTPPSETVEKALALVSVDDIHTSVHELRGGQPAISLRYTPLARAAFAGVPEGGMNRVLRE